MGKCRSCGAEILWKKTKEGKFMPVDIGSTESTEAVFDPATMKSHFATCPDAGKWRKPK